MALKREEGPGVAIRVFRTGAALQPEGPHPRVDGTPLPPWFEPERESVAGEFDGFWYELRGRGGKLLFRASGDDPTGASIEFPGAEGMGRKASPEVQHEFELLVPLAAALEAERLTIFSRQLAIYAGLLPTEPLEPLDFDITIKEEDLG